MKKNWDVPISVPGINKHEEGFFIGRDMEVQLLKNEIIRKDQGALLISGHRGVGKTSLIYKALHTVFKEINSDSSNALKSEIHKNDSSSNSKIERIEKQIILVLINAGQFDSKSKEDSFQISPEAILKTIIRRLFATTKSYSIGNLKKDLEDLYKKAISKEFKMQEILLQQLEHANLVETKKEFSLKMKDINSKQIIHFFSFLLSIGIFYFNPFEKILINQIIGLVLAFPAPFLLNAAISHNEILNKKKLQNKSAELLYQMDNNVSNIEYDLEELHRKFNNEGYKIVYVIDELDKLGDIKSVGKVIKYFKNLFTLSKALFLFIGNEDIYRNSTVEQDGEIFRPEQYTYFTSKFFISRPTWDELVSFINNCIHDDFKKLSNHELIRLQHYLAQEASNDFFKLINLMKDNICRYDHTGCPILKINIDDPEIIKKSRFHKCQMVLFNKKYYLSSLAERYDNEQLLRGLMRHSEDILKSDKKKEFKDPVDFDNVSAIKRDFNNLLAKLEVFSYESEKLEIINGIDVPIRNYLYTGYFKEDPPDRLNILTEYENRFLTQSLEYLKIILPVINYFGKKNEDSTIEDLRAIIGRGETLFLNNESFDLFKPDKIWEECFNALNNDLSTTNISREKIVTQEEFITQRLTRIGNSLFAFLIEFLQIEFQDEIVWVNPQDILNNESKIKYFGREIIKAIQEGSMSVFYDKKNSINHFIVKPWDSMIETLREIPESTSQIYFVTSSPKEIVINNIQNIKNDFREKLDFAIKNSFLINDTESLINKGKLLSRKILSFDLNQIYHSSEKIINANNEKISLSNRELEFLKLVCTELTYAEIANRMFVSARSIDGMRQALFDKLNVNSRVGLVMFSLRHGLINL